LDKLAYEIHFQLQVQLNQDQFFVELQFRMRFWLVLFQRQRPLRLHYRRQDL